MEWPFYYLRQSKEDMRGGAIMVFTFDYAGPVRGQGRPRFTRLGAGVRTYERLADVRYKQALRREYIEQGGPHFGSKPVSVTIAAMRALPETLSKRGAASEMDTHKPDLDNLAKAVLDALAGVAYDDDKQVTRLVVEKYPRIASGGDRLRVTVSDVGEMLYPYKYEIR